MSDSVARGRQFEEEIKTLLRGAGYIARTGKNPYWVLFNGYCIWSYAATRCKISENWKLQLERYHFQVPI